MGTSAAIRRGNEKFAKREDLKRGKPHKKQTTSEPLPLSKGWIGKYNH